MIEVDVSLQKSSRDSVPGSVLMFPYVSRDVVNHGPGRLVVGGLDLVDGYVDGRDDRSRGMYLISDVPGSGLESALSLD